MLFDFSEVFGEFNTPFQVLRKATGFRDYANGGQWVEDPNSSAPLDFTGIIAPMTDKDLRFDTAGTYTREDVKVYVRKPQELFEGDLVIAQGKTYRVMREREYMPEHADFRRYIARWTDAGKEGEDA